MIFPMLNSMIHWILPGFLMMTKQKKEKKLNYRYRKRQTKQHLKKMKSKSKTAPSLIINKEKLAIRLPNQTTSSNIPFRTGKSRSSTFNIVTTSTDQSTQKAIAHVSSKGSRSFRDKRQNLIEQDLLTSPIVKVSPSAVSTDMGNSPKIPSSSFKTLFSGLSHASWPELKKRTHSTSPIPAKKPEIVPDANKPKKWKTHELHRATRYRRTTQTLGSHSHKKGYQEL
eukprot:TRINITY_DN2716_c0_g1_i1.p1 TRINITY_DN2716_c0_g1~~TRINITY_DN2716_c0_g1_i1.p1  ORF type:complete len:226 (+),score=14.22 TRINITY_DN2716_c0_g1_i1:123-800(+)